MKLSITLKNERFAVFNPDTGELLSLPNEKPTQGSYIPVAEEDVKPILEGRDSMQFYYVHYIKRAKTYDLVLNDFAAAMVLYEKILLDHSSSIYVAESRKRFRELRGDNLKEDQ